MTGLDIDGGAAHDAAQRELSKPIYPRPSLTDQVTAWLDRVLYRIFTDGSWVPGGWITAAVLGAVLMAAVIVAVRVARRTMGTDRDSGAALFTGAELSAEQHRVEAEKSAAQGDWTRAIRHHMRAVARRLEESGTVDPVPGRTATELARDAGAALPALSDGFGRAAETFNGVTYGAQTGTEAGYRQIAELDRSLPRAATR